MDTSWSGDRGVTRRNGAPGTKPSAQRVAGRLERALTNVLLLGPATYTVSTSIVLLKNSAILGVPVGSAVGDAKLQTILQAANANVASVVQVGDGVNTNSGFGAVLQDLVVDGGGSGGGSQ